MLVDRTAAQPGDLVVFAADQAPAAAEVLGALRLALIALLAPEPSRRWALAGSSSSRSSRSTRRRAG